MFIHSADRTPRPSVRITLVRITPHHYEAYRNPDEVYTIRRWLGANGQIGQWRFGRNKGYSNTSREYPTLRAALLACMASTGHYARAIPTKDPTTLERCLRFQDANCAWWLAVWSGAGVHLYPDDYAPATTQEQGAVLAAARAQALRIFDRFVTDPALDRAGWAR